MSKIRLLDKWKLALRIAADKELSDAAKLIALRLLEHCNTQTGQCNPSYATLAKGSGKPRSRVIEVIPELEARGWVSVDRTSGGDGSSRRYVTNTYRMDFDRSEPDDEGSGNQDHPPSGKQDPSGVRKSGPPPSGYQDHPPSGKQDHPRPDIRTTYIENLGKEPGKVNLGKEPTGEAAPPPGTYSPPLVASVPEKEDAVIASASETTNAEATDAFASFEEFWRQYPKDANRARARKAWDKALKDGHDPQVIIAGAMRYAAERQGQPKKYTLLAANWLNDERWLDEPSSQDPEQSSRGADRREPSAFDVIRWRNEVVGAGNE